MKKYDKRRALAPRDLVARATHQEIKRQRNPFVQLDLRHIENGEFQERFPNIAK